MAAQDNNKKRKDPPNNTGPSKSSSTNYGANNSNGSRFHKRAKVYDARSIRSQPADAALSKNGELDLQSFLAAREFEIHALTNGMRNSKAVNNRRAFQQLPRGMRRRTASHNVKKLPKRLRIRAQREKIQDETPTVEARRRKPKTTRARIRVEMAKKLGVLTEKKRKRRLREAKERAKESGEADGNDQSKEKRTQVSAAIKQLIETRPTRPKIRRNLLNDPPKPKAKFRKRQINKTWLPTHMWHVKRARMTPPKEPWWRFAIPLTPNEKVYRPTHRASSTKGAIVWDMSYMSTISLTGQEAGIERTLRTLGMSHDSLWDGRGRKWREGRRKWSGALSKQQDDGRRQIGPATVFWNPEAPISRTSEDASSQRSKSERQVYIRLHPSCFLEVFNILVKLIKRETPRLHVEDLRFEIGSIDLTGPGATEALLGIIRPYHKDVKEVHAAVFESIMTANATVGFPPDSILGFSAQDPRLCYPPRPVERTTSDTCATKSGKVDSTLADAPPSPYLLFDRDARFRASLYPTQKALNRRKADNAPGKPLQVTTADPPFPIILISSRTQVSSQGTWTLLAPWKCILPIWYSLVHYQLSSGGNPRVGGLDELRQVTFEQGQPWFPGDFPGTDAGAEWELEQRQKRKAEWEKRPKSKRVEWKTLDLGAGRKGEVGIGWACEFERLFGLQKEPETEENIQEHLPLSDPNTKEKDRTGVQEEGAPVGEQSPNSVEATSAKHYPKDITPHPLTLVHHLSKVTFKALTNQRTTEAPPPYSLVTVKITFPGRGVVKPCARIYRLPQRSTASPVATFTQPEVPATQPPPKADKLPANLREQWLARLPGSATFGDAASNKPNNRPIRFPPNTDHDTQKLMFAKSLMTNKLSSFPPEKPLNGNGDHPPVPNEEDLIGYVTKGEFNLADGKGVAIGSVSVEKVLEALRTSDGDGGGYVCVVRDAGESIGWVARWEVI
ncbi:Ribonucleases P/MRP protein subunit pop1 [Gnomoniopsis smithogilvyi]|uniref:Ribonucleases P/MRP protein subunit pop1 n=1 Tax=Gnomoniopsis smithogilvyi TaxID=1191159 RepID=A0A9W9CTM7_9PEZI|nr:Ribonucleases P/MRP protein subunit pop1 [Gnomoniopsis smithogilvyi]